ncbi:MAG: DUF3089 domain-containing protein [Muribaculaceae bacterium]
MSKCLVFLRMLPLAIALMLQLVAAAQPAAPQYEQAESWWSGADGCIGSGVDVFYVLPTCVGAWQDSCGVMQFNADVRNAKHRRAWELSCQLGKQIFGNGTNFYLPYYRQATFGTPAERAAEVHAIAAGDVLRAFDYYLEHYNGGRQFVLAGFSQGACLLVEIIKHLNAETIKRMVVAYAVGGSVSASDLKHPNVRLARGATDRGVVVCFNTVADMGDATLGNVLFPDNMACINPVSWVTSQQRAVLKSQSEATQAHDPHFPYGTAVVASDAKRPVTVRIDKSKQVLVVDNIDPDPYMLPKMSDMFPRGCLHLQELFFYGKMLSANMQQRIEAASAPQNSLSNK